MDSISDKSFVANVLTKRLLRLDKAEWRSSRAIATSCLEPSIPSAPTQGRGEVVMVDQVLVAERDGKDVLADQRRQRVVATLIVAVGEPSREAADEPDRPISS